MMLLMILPSPPQSFAWTEYAGLPALVCTPLAEVAAHCLTTRQWPLGTGLLSPSGGDPWRVVADVVEVGVERLIRVRQVHGISVVSGMPPSTAPPPAADIIITRDASLAGAVQTADCVPLLIADPTTGAVAAVHCGWRGIALNAAGVAVAALAREWDAAPADLIAALGPSIGACCYEVGGEVRQRFAAAGTSEAALARWFLLKPPASDRNPSMPALRNRTGRIDRWFFDGWRAVAEQLQAAGLSDDRIFSAELCTASHPELFCSYRRDGEVAGRQVAVIRPSMRRP